VVRHAVDGFVLSENADEMLRLLGRFQSAWREFGVELERLGRKIDEAQDAFHRVTGTRARALERPLARLDALRQRRGLEPSPGDRETP
jgi:DNA recombination protein RmuC